VSPVATARVLLVGKPNSGKSLLFNRLTGLRQKVANFPGVTVEVKSGRADGFELVDLPGLYSLQPTSVDERVAIEQFRLAVRESDCAVVLCVLDSTRLERSLVLGLEAAHEAKIAGVPCVFGLNMTDELRAARQTIDAAGLARALGQRVVPVSGRTQEGLGVLRETLASLAAAPRAAVPMQAVDAGGVASVDTTSFDYPARARALAKDFAPSVEPLLARQTRIDQVTLHWLLGLVLFLVTMAVLFQAVFTWAAPLMDATKSALELLGETLAGLMPTAVLGDFVKDGLLGGISAVVVFVPQILLLTLMIGMLEDSGYLARAAMLCHRPLSFFGLSGKSFVPLLSGHACAIPAIMAARTIESPRARWLTWMAIPLMSCSARLPVYGLLIAAIIPDQTYLGGLFGLRGLTLLGLYVLGITSGLVVSGIVNRFAPKKAVRALPFVIELPPYRLPTWRPLLLRAATSAVAFVKRAGTTIFAVSIVVWTLGYFPGGAGHLETSYLSRLGHLVAPALAPIGLDWKFTVAVMTSFLAREVFVGTLGVLFGIEEAAEHAGDLAAQMQANGLTLASGLALLAFFAISLQCVSTLAVLRKESGSQRLPMAMVGAYAAIAYGVAVMVYQIAS
jgi:ferrous iron transport protein B